MWVCFLFYFFLFLPWPSLCARDRLSFPGTAHKKSDSGNIRNFGHEKKINENLEQVASEETREEQLFFGILFIFFKEPPEHVLSCWQKGPDLVLEGVLGAAESHRE